MVKALKKRIDIFKEIFSKEGIDGFLIASERNIFYFTGASGANFLFIPAKGDCKVYVYGVNYDAVKVEAKNCQVELIERGEKPENKVVQQVEKYEIKVLGFDSLLAQTFITLKRALRGKAKLKPKNELVWNLRKIKDEKELSLMRKAAEITSEGMKTAYEVLKAGMREYEVAAEIEYAMRKAGSWSLAFDTIVASGPRSAYPHGWCTDRKIRKGELVVVDIGAVYQNYRADMTRTLVAGKPTEKQLRIFNVVREAQEKAFRKVRAGRKARTVDRVARKVIEDAGFGEYFVHGTGHGIGLETHEPPTLNSQSKDKLEARNVVTVEPGIYITGFGGIRIEDTVLVKEKQAERLTKGPYTLTLG